MAKRRRYRFEHTAMACDWTTIIVGDSRDGAAQVADELFDEVDRLEMELSRFVPSSDIARISDLVPGQSLRIGIEACDCIALGRELYEASAGLFDIALGTGLPHLELDRANREVRVARSGIRLDLGGLGKGYALEQLIEPLERAISLGAPIDGAMVTSGQSSVIAFGDDLDGESWTVSLRHPDDSECVVHRVELGRGVLSGSGTAIKGDHIFDPRVGRSAHVRQQAAWAWAPSGALSDALSTTFMLLERDEIDRLVARWPDVRVWVL